jgi:hypothetical protein
MSQRAVEVAVGRLVTDEAFRLAFAREPGRALEQLVAQGLSFSEGEIRALVATRPALWREVGEQIDPDLQKASLRGE